MGIRIPKKAIAAYDPQGYVVGFGRAAKESELKAQNGDFIIDLCRSTENFSDFPNLEIGEVEFPDEQVGWNVTKDRLSELIESNPNKISLLTMPAAVLEGNKSSIYKEQYKRPYLFSIYDFENPKNRSKLRDMGFKDARGDIKPNEHVIARGWQLDVVPAEAFFAESRRLQILYGIKEIPCLSVERLHQQFNYQQEADMETYYSAGLHGSIKELPYHRRTGIICEKMLPDMTTEQLQYIPGSVLNDKLTSKILKNHPDALDWLDRSLFTEKQIHTAFCNSNSPRSVIKFMHPNMRIDEKEWSSAVKKDPIVLLYVPAHLKNEKMCRNILSSNVPIPSLVLEKIPYPQVIVDSVKHNSNIGYTSTIDGLSPVIKQEVDQLLINESRFHNELDTNKNRGITL
ncbi:MAG: hypothetical protein LUF87_02080 [Alistipes sp.]|nr:hypothetical protein [Alistipes sp.]